MNADSFAASRFVVIESRGCGDATAMRGVFRQRCGEPAFAKTGGNGVDNGLGQAKKDRECLNCNAGVGSRWLLPIQAATGGQIRATVFGSQEFKARKYLGPPLRGS